MPKLGELARVAFASDDGPENLLAGLASHIAQDMGQLHIHLLERLLQVQNVRRTMLNEFRPVAQVGA